MANASLDTAFHDKLINKKKEINETDVISLRSMADNNNYIEQYFVGLLEGDGTITTNLNSNRSNSIIIRIVISLKNRPENVSMLNKIKETLGGREIIERKNNYVTWIASNKNDLAKVFIVLAKYPLLTARKQCQLEFALNCLLEKNVTNFIVFRNTKYKNKKPFLANFATQDKFPLYFSPWLSGFIEAQGNFNLLLNEKGVVRISRFSIGQNDEIHILNWIKLYFKSNNVISKDKPKN